jgi:hypothetical protein
MQHAQARYRSQHRTGQSCPAWVPVIRLASSHGRCGLHLGGAFIPQQLPSVYPPGIGSAGPLAKEGAGTEQRPARLNATAGRKHCVRLPGPR